MHSYPAIPSYSRYQHEPDKYPVYESGKYSYKFNCTYIDEITIFNFVNKLL